MVLNFKCFLEMLVLLQSALCKMLIKMNFSQKERVLRNGVDSYGNQK